MPVFITAWAFLQLAASRGYSLVLRRLLTAVASRVTEHGLRAHRRPGPRAGSVVAVHELVAAQHVGSSWGRDQTHVYCPSRQVLYH